MEITGSDLLKQARELLEKGEHLDKAFYQFNVLYNETLNGKGDGEKDIFLFYLASTCMKLNYDALSILLFKEAIKENPKFLEAINNLGYMYKKAADYDKSTECFKRVLELMNDPTIKVSKEDRADYWTNFGSLLIANGTPYEAMEYFDKASAISDHNPYNKWNRALIHLELGDYENGFNNYDYGDRDEKNKSRNYGIENLPTWDGTPGQSVVVYGEQGIGDEIMFASMIHDLMKTNRVIIDAHPRLADLFRFNFPKVPVYGTRKDTCSNIKWPQYHKIDAKIAMGSLAKFYRTKPEMFPKKPYLKAHPALVEKYQKKLAELGDLPKIGISWMGGTKLTHSNNRCIPLDMFKDIVNLEDFNFISLQYNKHIGKEVKKFEEENQVSLNHWQDTLDDYDETAGLVANLDLIISVPQSVVHLAGAMGTPVWQLCPYKAMWQMGVRGQEMPWYGCTKNIWQDESCSWEPVLEKVKDDLCNLLATAINN